MLPSEELRRNISQLYNINLEQYKWSEDLKQTIFSIKLDKDLESNADCLEEIYINGFNIGHCGLTSRYIARKFNEATLYYGKSILLIGTESAPNGEHAWTTINNFLIDSTLMIAIPKTEAIKLGYITEKEIAYDSARMLSEFDRYDNDFNKKKQRLTK
jgi:hypothetical protein